MTIVGYTMALIGMGVVPMEVLFTITAEEEGERFCQRLWSTIRKRTFCTKFLGSFRPNKSWGPTGLKERADWQVHSETHGRLDFLPSPVKRCLGLQDPGLPTKLDNGH